MKKINYLKIFFTTFLLTSCLIYDAHEVFKGDMSSGVGKSMDVALWANSKYTPVNSKKLKNGNIENEYEFRGTCRYFFEFDPKTRIIVNWRFTGSKEDCRIAS